MGLVLESSTVELLLLALLLVYYLYQRSASAFNFWKDRGVPFIKPLPIVGNSLDTLIFKKSSNELFKGFYFSEELKNEKYGGVYLGRNPVLIVRDPDLIKEVLIKDFPSFSHRGLPVNLKDEPLTGHLFNLGGWQWRALRTKLTPTFTSGKMKMMFGLMAECADGLEKMLEKPAQNSEMIEMKEPLAKFTTDVIGTCAFGLQLNSMSDSESEFRVIGRKMFEPSKEVVLRRFLLSSVPFMTRFIRTSFILSKETSKFFLGVVNDMVTYREENNFTRNDFMQLLIDIKHKDANDKVQSPKNDVAEDGSEHQKFDMTNELLAAQAFVFFVAGFETSSTAMSFALHELAQHQDIQDKLVREVEDVVSKNSGKLTYDAIQEMKYMDMVISETLRKFPPVGNLVRKCTKPFKLEETNTLIDGIRVIIPVPALQMDPKYYPDPEKFDPDRFTPEEKAKRHPMLYLPFGEGPKNCIGARFGLLQTKIGLATVLRKYKVEVCEKTTLPTKLDPLTLVSAIQGGTWLKISRRTSS